MLIKKRKEKTNTCHEKREKQDHQITHKEKTEVEAVTTWLMMTMMTTTVTPTAVVVTKTQLRTREEGKGGGRKEEANKQRGVTLQTV